MQKYMDHLVQLAIQEAFRENEVERRKSKERHPSNYRKNTKNTNGDRK